MITGGSPARQLANLQLLRIPAAQHWKLTGMVSRIFYQLIPPNKCGIFGNARIEKTEKMTSRASTAFAVDCSIFWGLLKLASFWVRNENSPKQYHQAGSDLGDLKMASPGMICILWDGVPPLPTPTVMAIDQL